MRLSTEEALRACSLYKLRAKPVGFWDGAALGVNYGWPGCKFTEDHVRLCFCECFLRERFDIGLHGGPPAGEAAQWRSRSTGWHSWSSFLAAARFYRATITFAASSDRRSCSTAMVAMPCAHFASRAATTCWLPVSHDSLESLPAIELGASLDGSAA